MRYIKTLHALHAAYLRPGTPIRIEAKGPARRACSDRTLTRYQRVAPSLRRTRTRSLGALISANSQSILAPTLALSPTDVVAVLHVDLVDTDIRTTLPQKSGYVPACRLTRTYSIEKSYDWVRRRALAMRLM